MPKGGGKKARPARKARPSKVPKTAPPADLAPAMHAMVERADLLSRQGLMAADVRRQLVVEGAAETDAWQAIALMHERVWMPRENEDAPFRRIRYRLTAEDMLQKSIASKSWVAAERILSRLMRDPGDVRQRDEEAKQALIGYAGDLPPATDTLGRVEWASRVMAFEMFKAATNTALDPVDRFRMVMDAGAKIGFTYNKASVEVFATDTRRMIEGPQKNTADELTDTTGITPPETSRFAKPGAGRRSVPDDPPDPDEGEDG
jgi:hypothetical protein